MRDIGAFEAKTHLSELLDQVAKGERVRITRRGTPVAMLVPLADEPALSATDAAARLRELRADTTLGADLSLRVLIDEGRR